MAAPAVFHAGYYNLDAPGLGWAQHTFVIASANGSPVNFQCYGGLQGPKRVYPAKLYTPAVTSYTDLGTQATGNVDLARAIATSDPHAPPRSDYGQHTGGATLLGDNSGVLYAITGVCHQMEARILYATHAKGAAPVEWPPTATATYWKFGGPTGGFYGSDWHLWKPIYDRWAKGNLVSAADVIRSVQQLHHPDSPLLMQAPQVAAVRAVHIQSTLSAALGALVAAQQSAPCTEKDLQFESLKRDLDAQLFRCQISNAQYAEAVNTGFANLARELADILGPDDYQKVFRVPPDQELSLSIDPAMMPPSYALGRQE